MLRLPPALGDNFSIHRNPLRSYLTASHGQPFHRMFVEEWPWRYNDNKGESCSPETNIESKRDILESVPDNKRNDL